MMSCSSEPTNPDNSTSARVMIWQIVKAKLKNPKTAEFDSFKPIRTSDHHWKASSVVESKNGIGMTVRTHFYCEINHVKGSSWEIIKLTFD